MRGSKGIRPSSGTPKGRSSAAGRPKSGWTSPQVGHTYAVIFSTRPMTGVCKRSRAMGIDFATTSWDTAGVKAQLVAAHTEHCRERWAIDVCIHNAHTPALQGKKRRQIRGHRAFTHPTFATHHGNGMLHPGHTGPEPGHLLSDLPGDI